MIKYLLKRFDEASVRNVKMMDEYMVIRAQSSLFIYPIWILLYIIVRIFGGNVFFNEIIYNYIKLFNNPIITAIIFGAVELFLLFFIFEILFSFVFFIYANIKSLFRNIILRNINYLILNVLIFNIPVFTVFLMFYIQWSPEIPFPIWIFEELSGFGSHSIAFLLWSILPPIFDWYANRRVK